MDRILPASAAPLMGLLLLVACGSPPDARHPDDAVATESGGRIEPTNATEKQVLSALDQLKPGVAQKVGNVTATADAPYLAASGQQCKSVRWAEQARLACRDEHGWYFVPDVFGSAEGPGP